MAKGKVIICAKGDGHHPAGNITDAQVPRSRNVIALMVSEEPKIIPDIMREVRRG